MVEVKVFKGGSVATQEVDAGAFGTKVLGRTLKDAVVMYEANQRQGTVRAKTRSQVRGGNHKLYPQKHTGRARMGTTKSPIWRGGGRIHPPQPRDHSYAMPKKARRVALRNAIFTKFRDGEVAIADGWPTDAPSTKSAVAILAQLDMGISVTVVTDGADKTLYKSLRNVPLIDVARLDDLNARQVLLRRYLVLTSAAYELLEKKFAKSEPAPSGSAPSGSAPSKPSPSKPSPSKPAASKRAPSKKGKAAGKGKAADTGGES